MKKLNNRIAIIISDIHMSLKTYDVALAALKYALATCQDLNLPLIIAGDLTDGKASMRAECTNALIELFKQAAVPIFVIPGNHDLINAHSKEHALEFLRPYVTLCDTPTIISLNNINIGLIPYLHSNEEFIKAVKQLKTNRFIVHQGLLGANMGPYAIDKTSVDPNEFKDLKATFISGHYHKFQTYQIPNGSWTYIGSPFTQTFGEANDGPKGILFLNEDFTISQIKMSHLRKHVIVSRDADSVLNPIPDLESNDLLRLKVVGPASKLKLLNKKEIGQALLGHSHFKLELEYTDIETPYKKINKLSDKQLFLELVSKYKSEYPNIVDLANDMLDKVKT